MINVLIVEVFAVSTFQWAEEVLSDPAVSDAPKDAADMVRHIRADESPHVEYLRTALSETFGAHADCRGRQPAQRPRDRSRPDRRSLNLILRQRREERRAQMHASIRAGGEGNRGRCRRA